MKALLAPALLLAGLLAAPTTAQSCSDLTISGSGAPGGTLTFDLTGADANALALMAVGDTTGSTTVSNPLLTVTIGLASPFGIVPLGMTDGNGDASLSVTMPTAPIPLTTLHAQAMTVAFSFGSGRPSLDACTSDVEQFQIGS